MESLIKEYEQQIWKPIGIGNYEISNIGNMRKGNQIINGTNKQAKKVYSLTHEGRRFYRQAHILVAKHFVEDIPYKCLIKFKDGNCLNCRASNLEYINKEKKEQNYKIDQSNAEYFN
jgi:hypothetical protein